MEEIGLRWKPYQLADLEGGRRQDLTLSELALLAESLGVHLADLLEGSGSIQLSETERPMHVVRDMMAGELAPNSDLLGPTEIPGFGEGPYWTKAGNKQGQIFSAEVVSYARRLGVDVEWVHRLATKVGTTPERLSRGVLSDAEYERLATALGQAEDDPQAPPQPVRERILELARAA